ncbi:MAG: hypothetical protein R3E09_05735 [Novosphingobium sp.]|nr:hypothetical protein [Novosphingobium sp.]
MLRIVSRIGHLPIAPFAIPVMVCAPIWSHNILRLAYKHMLPTVLVLLGITALVLVAIRLFVKSWARASLIALVWAGYLLYLQPLVSTFTDNDWVMLAAIAIGALLAWDISRRAPTDEAKLAEANGFANIAVWIPALFLFGNVLTKQVALEHSRPDPIKTFASLPGKADTNSPDVWHIVMDRYAGSTTLSEDYGFDNSKFLDALRERDFAIADDAYSNYQITPLSLASTLNAAYLDSYTDRIKVKTDIVPLFSAIDRNAAFRFFKRQGYEIVFSGSWADITVENSLADRDINFRAFSEVPRIAITQSVPGVIGAKLGVPFTDGRKDQCLRIKYKFDRLREVAAEPGRKLVFAHFLLPHPPYVVSAAGACQNLEVAQNNSRNHNYAGQVEFANHELLRLVDAILAGPRPATIVIHADEGPYPAQFAFDEPEHRPPSAHGKNWMTSDTGVRRQKTNIIMALRHADGKSEEAPRTPVNLYPIILNRSFNARIPLRQDHTLMYASELDLGELTDVSEELY